MSTASVNPESVTPETFVPGGERVESQMYGTMESGGRVRIVKQYTGRHQVDYVGTYDGEGTLFGTWLIEMLAGSWSIKLLRAAG